MAAGNRREWLTSMTMWAWPPAWHTLEALEVVFVDEKRLPGCYGGSYYPRSLGAMDPYRLPKSTEPGARFVLTLLWWPMECLGLGSTPIERMSPSLRRGASKRILMRVRDELDDTLVEARLIAKLIKTERRFAPQLRLILLLHFRDDDEAAAAAAAVRAAVAGLL